MLRVTWCVAYVYPLLFSFLLFGKTLYVALIMSFSGVVQIRFPVHYQE